MLFSCVDICLICVIFEFGCLAVSLKIGLIYSCFGILMSDGLFIIVLLAYCYSI